MSCGTDETFPRERSGYVGQAVKGDVEQDPYAFVEAESLPGVGGEDPAGSGGGAKGPGRRGCGLGLCDPIGGLLGKKLVQRARADVGQPAVGVHGTTVRKQEVVRPTGTARSGDDPYTALMYERVVASTEQQHVVEISRAAVRPGDDVVRIEAVVAVAARELTGPVVTDTECAALGAGCEAFGAAQCEHSPVPIDHDALQRRGTHQPLSGLGLDRPGSVHVTDARRERCGPSGYRRGLLVGRSRGNVFGRSRGNV